MEFLNRDVILLILLCFLYLVWVVVPLVPAVIIYRLFPTVQTNAQWQIMGVALKAGGASGFYFAILALGFFRFLEPTIDYVKEMRRPFWTIEAAVKFYDADNKNIIPQTNALEKISVQPYAFDFKQTDEQTYLVTMRFSELSGDTDSIRLIFPEGVGFIHLKDLMSTAHTDKFLKRVSLPRDKPTEIRPPVKGGQNLPSPTVFSTTLQQSLETNDLGMGKK